MTNATIHKLECRKTGNYEKPLQTNAPRSFLPPLTRGRTSRRSSTVINPKRTHTHTHTHTHTGASAALHARASVSRQAGTRAPLGTLAAHPHPATPHGRAGRSPRPPARPPGKRWLPGWGQGRGRGGAGKGGERRGAGPRRLGRGRGAGTGRRPAHVGGQEQLKVRSGARAVLSRAALAPGGGGGGEGGGGGVGGGRRRWRRRKKRGGRGRRRTGAERRHELPGALS